jgi:hypothetical protein
MADESRLYQYDLKLVKRANSGLERGRASHKSLDVSKPN